MVQKKALAMERCFGGKSLGGQVLEAELIMIVKLQLQEVDVVAVHNGCVVLCCGCRSLPEKWG